MDTDPTSNCHATSPTWILTVPRTPPSYEAWAPPAPNAATGPDPTKTNPSLHWSAEDWLAKRLTSNAILMMKNRLSQLWRKTNKSKSKKRKKDFQNLKSSVIGASSPISALPASPQNARKSTPHKGVEAWNPWSCPKFLKKRGKKINWKTYNFQS